MPYQPGDILLDKYRIELLIGQGAFSDVYKATHLGLNVERALKVLRRDSPGIGSTEFTEIKQRFELEARLGAVLNSPKLFAVYDYQSDDSFAVLEMEYAPKGSLGQILEQLRQSGRLVPIKTVIKIGMDVASGLCVLHEKDIVHRDLKPANILFDAQGNARVSDLGLAQVTGGPSQRSKLSNSLPHPGTPGYMSPEQMSATGWLMPPSDVYALGLVLFEVLTGRVCRSQKPNTRPQSLRNDTPPVLDNLVMRMLSLSPEDRPWDGCETFNLLQDCLKSLEKKNEERWSIAASEKVREDPPKVDYDAVPSINKPNRATWVSLWIQKIKGFFPTAVKVSPRGNETESSLEKWKKSGSMTVNLMAVLEPRSQKKLVTLVNRDHELRIKDILVNFAGGKYLIHGFGRFGSSALIDQIVEKVRAELSKGVGSNQTGFVLMARIELGDFSNESQVIGAIVKDFRFESKRGGHAKSIVKQLEKLQKNKFTKVSESSTENTISIKATPIPGIETAFSRKSDQTVVPVPGITSPNGIIDVIGQFLDSAEKKKVNLLEKMMLRAASSGNNLSRVIVVLDKIESEKTFQILQNMRLFSDERITFFAIVKEEVYLNWKNPTLQFIKNLGFSEHYVPCIWEENFHLVREMVQNSAFVANIDENDISDFINHIAYKTKGAPGDVVRELVSPAYNTYKEGFPKPSIGSIRDKKLVVNNAWRQEFLSRHWADILGGSYLTVRDEDIAKIGVYEIIELMNHLVEFQIKDLQNPKQPVDVFSNIPPAIRAEIISNLLLYMEKDGLVRQVARGRFRVIYKDSDTTKPAQYFKRETQ